jgi:hypothetical protein
MFQLIQMIRRLISIFMYKLNKLLVVKYRFLCSDCPILSSDYADASCTAMRPLSAVILFTPVKLQSYASKSAR